MKAAQTVENTGKSGITVPKADGVLDLETGVRYQLAKGSKLQDVEVFAGKGSKKEFRQDEKRKDTVEMLRIGSMQREKDCWKQMKAT